MLQWGRSLLAAGFAGAGALFLMAVMLQWGRSLLAAGLSYASVGGHGDPHASMGPQLVGCGIGQAPPRMEQKDGGFNGAAACWLRDSTSSVGYRLSVTLGFNGAAACWLRD